MATLLLLPRQHGSSEAGLLFEGDVQVQQRLGDDVVQRLASHPELHFYKTGSKRFDGQSAIATYQMAILGLGQIVLEHPELRERYMPTIRDAAGRLVEPATLSYAAQKYGAHGIVRMAPAAGHAYLGYINLALGMLRVLEPDTPHAALHDRLSAQLSERLFAAPRGMIETYPGESWPPDVAAVAGSIGLHARATGMDYASRLAVWRRRFQECAIDDSGFLIQRLHTASCRPADAPRGSGTAVGAYFLSFVDQELSGRLHTALSRQIVTLLGFGAAREYPPGHTGSGDGNSGPVVFGVSVGATGFGIGSARAHGDRDSFIAMYKTAHLFGAATSRDGATTFATGGVLGNALLLAMVTARSAD